MNVQAVGALHVGDPPVMPMMGLSPPGVMLMGPAREMRPLMGIHEGP